MSDTASEPDDGQGRVPVFSTLTGTAIVEFGSAEMAAAPRYTAERAGTGSRWAACGVKLRGVLPMTEEGGKETFNGFHKGFPALS